MEKIFSTLCYLVKNYPLSNTTKVNLHCKKCTTMVNDSMNDSKPNSSYEHGSDFERLRSYGHFLIPIHALV